MHIMFNKVQHNLDTLCDKQMKACNMINFISNNKKIKKLEKEIFKLEKLNEQYKKFYYEEFTKKENLLIALVELNLKYKKLKKRFNRFTNQRLTTKAKRKETNGRNS